VPCVTPTLNPSVVNEVIKEVSQLVEGCKRCCPPECNDVWACESVLKECNTPGRRGRKPERCKECQELWDRYAEVCNSCVKECPHECSELKVVVLGRMAKAAVSYVVDLDSLVSAKAVEGAYELLRGQTWAAVTSKALREWLAEVKKSPLYYGRYYPDYSCCIAALSLNYMLGALVKDSKAHALLNSIRGELVAGVCTVPIESVWAAEALLSYIFATSAV